MLEAQWDFLPRNLQRKLRMRVREDGTLQIVGQLRRLRMETRIDFVKSTRKGRPRKRKILEYRSVSASSASTQHLPLSQHMLTHLSQNLSPNWGRSRSSKIG